MKQKLSITLGTALFTILVTSLALAEYSQEVKNAYNWAFSYKITTQPTIDDARLDQEITRQAMAKMIVNFSKNFSQRTLDESKSCTFIDNDITDDLVPYVKQACQLGLMGQNTNVFKPRDSVTKAQFAAMLSRSIWWNKYEGSEPYYIAHMAALQEAGILDNTPNPEKENMTRANVLLALQKATNISWKSALALEENKWFSNFFDPEIEALMNNKQLTEEQKKAIRKTLLDNENTFLEIEDLLKSGIEDDDFTLDDAKANKYIKATENIKNTILPKYISTIKSIYSGLWVDVTKQDKYTAGEKIKEIEKMWNALTDYLDTSVEVLNFFRWIYKTVKIGEDWDFIFDNEEIENQIKSKAEELNKKWEDIKDKFEQATEDYMEYLSEYQENNQYRSTYSSILNDEISDYILDYNPTEAVFKNWVYIRSDGVTYKGEISNNKFHGKGILTFENWSYYSWEFKNHYYDGYWEFKDNDYYFIWYLKKWEPEWTWFLKENDETYSWSFKNGQKHGYGEFTTPEYTFKGIWDNDKMKEGIITSQIGYTYSWGFNQWTMDGYGILTLPTGETYEGFFEDWEANWSWTLTTKAWEKYSWVWNKGFLSWENLYFWAWKLVKGKDIIITENQWNNTIIISDGKDNLTIMDKNVWATENWTWKEAYGSFFKYGNNTPFSSSSINEDYKGFQNATTGTWKEKEQWPCPNGFHIPTRQEWTWLINLFDLKNQFDEGTAWRVPWETTNKFSSSLQLPFSGIRYIHGDENEITDQESQNDENKLWYYWTSDNYYMYFSNLKDKDWATRWWFWFSNNTNKWQAVAIRCFKN